jgi:hypothetical protein
MTEVEMKSRLDKLNRPSQRLFKELATEICQSNKISDWCHAVDQQIYFYRKQYKTLLVYLYFADYLLSSVPKESKGPKGGSEFHFHWHQYKKTYLMKLINHYYAPTPIELQLLWEKWSQGPKKERLRSDFVPWLHDYPPPACDLCKINFSIKFDQDNETWFCESACLIDDQILRHQFCDNEFLRSDNTQSKSFCSINSVPPAPVEPESSK